VGLLAFGIVLSIIGLFALALALPALGWSLVALGAVLAVTHVAVGPERHQPRFRSR